MVKILLPFTISLFLFSFKPIGYNFQNPNTRVELPQVLTEVSGLTIIDQHTIACIQDEKGVLFIYDLLQNKIRDQHHFHGDGDYEGITVVGNTMYVLRSDGMLYEITNYDKSNRFVKNYQTGIPALNNEGLCYDESNKRLLIASKSKIGKGPELKDKRFVYSFDLETKKLVQTPAYTFDIPSIRDQASKSGASLPLRTKKKGNAQPVLKFFPSAIAIHPITKQLYLLSAADHMLFIFNPNGTLHHTEVLNSTVFNKAEGITFFPNGDMLITNEGQNKKPTMLRFNFQN